MEAKAKTPPSPFSFMWVEGSVRAQGALSGSWLRFQELMTVQVRLSYPFDPSALGLSHQVIYPKHKMCCPCLQPFHDSLICTRNLSAWGSLCLLKPLPNPEYSAHT